jgi:hypothetical protein
LEKSCEKRNGILGIYIHQLKDKDGRTDGKGSNEFGANFKSKYDDKQYFYERFETYDWATDGDI